MSCLLAADTLAEIWAKAESWNAVYVILDRKSPVPKILKVITTYYDEPEKDYTKIPGGGNKKWEATPAETARRELFEETRLTVR